MLQILKTFYPFHLFRNYHFVCTTCAGNMRSKHAINMVKEKTTLFKKQGVHRIHLMGTCGSTALPQNDTMYCGQHYEQVTSASRNTTFGVTFGPITAPMLSPQKRSVQKRLGTTFAHHIMPFARYFEVVVFLFNK